MLSFICCSSTDTYVCVCNAKKWQTHATNTVPCMQHSRIAAMRKQQRSKGKQPSESSDAKWLLCPAASGCLSPDWKDTLNLARIFGCMLHTSFTASNDAENSKISTKQILAQPSTAQRSAAQHSTAQYSTAQHSTVLAQHNMTQAGTQDKTSIQAGTCHMAERDCCCSATPAKSVQYMCSTVGTNRTATVLPGLCIKRLPTSIWNAQSRSSQTQADSR